MEAISKPPPKVSKELTTAFVDDALYKARDAAKFRAVGQRVDYDTFKNMVSVAHLRPLQAPSLHGADACAPAFQFAPDGTRVLEQPGEIRVAELASALPLLPPATAAEFEQVWRRSCTGGEERLRYLRLVGPAALGALFKVEIPLVLIGEIVVVLDSLYPAEDSANDPAGGPAEAAGARAEEAAEGGAAGEGAAERAAAGVESARFLLGLTTAGRFALTVRLLSGKARGALAGLLQRLSDAEGAFSSAKIPPSPILAEELAAAAEGPGSGGGDYALAEAVAELRLKFPGFPKR